MTETDPKDRFFAHQIMHGFVCVRKRRGIARTVGEKNSIGIKTQHFVCRRSRRHNRYLETFLAQQAQDVFLDAIIVCSNSRSNGWQSPSAFAVSWLCDRPRRAEVVLRIPAVNLSCRHFTHIIHPDYALALDRHLRRFFGRNLLGR